MSQVFDPSSARVRSAAEALKVAIDRHLAAVQHRDGATTPEVGQAFEELQSAAEAYDDVLYDVYEEVTPFEFGEGGPGQNQVEAVSVRIRRDYLIDDRSALIASGREAYLADRPEASPESAAKAVDSTETAVAALFDAHDPDQLDEHAERLGLAPLGATLWVVAGENAEAERWLGQPFTACDADQVLYRLDVTVKDEEFEGPEVAAGQEDTAPAG